MRFLAAILIMAASIVHVKSDLLNIEYSAPWNLARLSRVKPVDMQYVKDLEYHYLASGGEGVDIYVLDAGVMINHVEFEDRARWGGTFTQSKPGLFNEFDINGHGTQCASIAAGKRLGVAKKANIIAVKTADKTIIHFSNVVRGLMYVLRAYQESGRPSIALLAFAGGPDQRLDEAAALLIREGVHVVAAAGNWGDNRRVSPAHVPGVISVGAIDMYDMAAKFSNWDIDLYAPGVDIIAATTGSTPRMNQKLTLMTGTSAAAPHVAGVIACILSRDKGKKTWKPLEMLAELKRIALRNVLSNVHNPSSNLLLHFMPEDHTLPPAKPQHVDPKIRVPSRHSEVGYLHSAKFRHLSNGPSMHLVESKA